MFVERRILRSNDKNSRNLSEFRHIKLRRENSNLWNHNESNHEKSLFFIIFRDLWISSIFFRTFLHDAKSSEIVKVKSSRFKTKWILFYEVTSVSIIEYFSLPLQLYSSLRIPKCDTLWHTFVKKYILSKLLESTTLGVKKKTRRNFTKEQRIRVSILLKNSL